MNLTSLIFFASSLGTLCSAPNSFADEPAPAPIPNARAAELSLHRIERLVILKKITDDYETKFSNLELSEVPAGDPDGAHFVALAKEYPGAGGSASSLQIFMDPAGKTVRFTQAAGAASVAAPSWPNADSVTLSENALHWIEAATDPNIAPYLNSLVTLKITQGKDPAGVVVALIDVTSSETPKTLRVLMTTDGNFESASILP